MHAADSVRRGSWNLRILFVKTLLAAPETRNPAPPKTRAESTKTAWRRPGTWGGSTRRAGPGFLVMIAHPNTKVAQIAKASIPGKNPLIW